MGGGHSSHYIISADPWGLLRLVCCLFNRNVSRIVVGFHERQEKCWEVSYICLVAVEFPTILGMGQSLSLSRKGLFVFRVALVTTAFFWVLWLGWVSDDALISLRHSLNWVNGWGAGFNAIESVQGYTHPLWFLLWSGVGLATGEWIWGVLILSAALSAAAIGIILWRTPSFVVGTAAFLILLGSNSFFDFSASGLENPLGFFLVGTLVSFTWVTTVNKKVSLGNAILTGSLISAIFLTRYDLVLIVLPLTILLFWKNRSNVRWVIAVAGTIITPILLWGLFSWMTYSSFFPNTFLAKQNVGLSYWEQIEYGMNYIGFSLSRDIFTAIIFLVGGIVILLKGNLFIRVSFGGVAAYLGYVVWIGGDFMAGRFLAVPVYMTVILAVMAVTNSKSEGAAGKIFQGESSLSDSFMWTGYVFAAIFVMFVGALLVGSPPTATGVIPGPRWDFSWHWHGIADERGYYVIRGMGTKNLLGGEKTEGGIAIGNIHSIDAATKAYKKNTNGKAMSFPVEVNATGYLCGGLGVMGIKNGPLTHVVDRCALTDRFLAELPFERNETFLTEQKKVLGEKVRWRAGHFPREIPEGYLEALQENDHLRLEDGVLRDRLGELWQQIR